MWNLPSESTEQPSVRTTALRHPLPQVQSEGDGGELTSYLIQSYSQSNTEAGSSPQFPTVSNLVLASSSPVAFQGPSKPSQLLQVPSAMSLSLADALILFYIF